MTQAPKSYIAPPGSYGKIKISIEPTDTKYAKDLATYPPDKSGLWTAPMETYGWFLEHCNIRSECTKMADVLDKLGTKTLEEWEIESLRSWFANHNLHIHEHHMHEDNIFTPFMQTRINLPEKLTTDHVQLVALLKAVMTIVEGQLASASVLRPAFEEYQKMLFTHLKEVRHSTPVAIAPACPARGSA